MRVLNRRRLTVFEARFVSDGMAHTLEPVGITIHCQPGDTPGEVMMANFPHIQEDQKRWFLRFVHKCERGGDLDLWFKRKEDLPAVPGTAGRCPRCGFVCLETVKA